MEDKFDLTLKILVLGDSGVGKTNFINQFLNHGFHQKYMSTTGIDLRTGNIEIKNQKIRIQIWDTAGQEKYKAITKNLFLKVMGALILYDITDENSFNNLKLWVSMVKEECGKHMKIVIVGNKIDLDDQRVKSKEEVLDYAKEQKVEYIETSCKTGENIKKAVILLGEKILESSELTEDASFRLDSGSFSMQNRRKCC